MKNKLESGLSYIIFVIFVSLVSSGFAYLGLPANNWLALFMLFLSILTASIVQLGYRNFKRGANGKTKDY